VYSLSLLVPRVENSYGLKNTDTCQERSYGPKNVDMGLTGKLLRSTSLYDVADKLL
jgi:hypothetical protein